MRTKASSLGALVVACSVVCLILPACRQPTPEEASRQAGVRRAPSAGTPAPVENEGPVVTFLGDSITAGLGVSQQEAFPALVSALLREAGVPIHAVQAGVNGDTSSGGLERLGWLLRADPAVVVVELGANDGLRGQPVEATERNIRAIVDRCLDSGAQVVLLGMQIPPSYGPEYSADFQELYRRVARDRDVILVPAFLERVGGVARLNQADGIHPNVAGHRRLAAKLAGPLQEALRRANTD
ncbi:MAG: arylesterase [Acidobacteriota bacterium]